MVLAVGLAAALAAASLPAKAQTAVAQPWDPIETVNRAVYNFNVAFATTVAWPVADAYRATVPEAVQAGVDNVFTNLREPVTAVSSGLQGDLNNAGLSVGRFAVNSTAGIGGIFDVATRLGWVSRPQDLGATLCSYNVPAGPYLVLPFIGPATTREAVGLGLVWYATFGLLDEWALTYIVADRGAAFAADPPRDVSGAADPYLARRADYYAVREAACDAATPAERLKASPLGQVVETAPKS
jgi:phospholipid-binding lipoprotein MlaA